MNTPVPLSLSMKERDELTALLHSEKNVKHWKRYRAILTRAEINNPEEAAKITGISTRQLSRHVEAFRQQGIEGIKIKKQPTVTLVDYDKDAEIKVVAAALYQFSHHPLSQLRKMAKKMTAEERMKVIDEYMQKRSSRRERPLRAAEATYYQFDVLSDYGAYRDLQRHRIMTQIPQLLTVEHGYDVPPEIIEAGFGEQFNRCMKKAAAGYRKIAAEMPNEAQYVVPLAYHFRYLMQFNLREAYHLIELRSTPQGHPSYRHIVQEMYRQIRAVHPALVHYMKYVNMDELDALGRLKSELRKEEKLAAMKKTEQPVKFLTSQIKPDIDAVKLVKNAREDFK
mgnify:CR=1 FL=1